MEAAIRWSPSSTTDEQRFLLVDVTGKSFRICRATTLGGSSVKYDILSSRVDVPSFRSFDWSPVDEELLAVGQSSGEASVLRMNDESHQPAIVFPVRNQRYCNAIALNTEGFLAAGLDKVRNDSCLNVYDLNQRTTLGRVARGGAAGADRQPIEPLRKLASSESITSVKFFKNQPETLVAGVKGQHVRVYDLRDNNSNPLIQFPTRCVHNLAIDWLDENYIASCYPTNDASICIWDRRAASRYPVTAVASSTDSSNLSPALEFRYPVEADSTIWSLRFSRTRRGFLGMVSSAGEFRAYNIVKEYVSDEYRSSMEHTFGQDSANSPEPIYTKNVREFRKHPLTRRKGNNVKDEDRVVAFDFLNYDMSNAHSAVTVLADRTVSLSFLPPSSPCPMDLSSQGTLASSGYSQGSPDIKFSKPSFGPGAKASEVMRAIQKKAAPQTDQNDTSTSETNPLAFNDGPGHSSRDYLDRLLTNGASFSVSDALAELTLRRLRCQEGYLLDSEKNKNILSDDPALQDLWDWTGRARSRSSDGSMVVRGVDMNYLGVYNVWNGLLGQTLASRAAGSDFGDSNPNISMLFHELAQQSNLPKTKICASKSPDRRRLCLRICGAKETVNELEATMKELVADRQHTKAAALAFFHDEKQLAYQALRQNQPTQAHKTLAMAIVGSSKGASDPDWEETCAEIAKELTDPYARAILALVSRGDWHAAVDEVTLPLRDRVEVALRWLPDYELTIFLRKATIEAKQEGNVEGVVLTGLDHGALELFEAYINKYNDTQTPALAMSHVVPRILNDTESRTRFDAWCKTYRRRINSWKLPLDRARFDVEIRKLATSWDGRKLVRPPRQQVSLVCNYCTRPLSQQNKMASTDDGPETVHLTAGNPLGSAAMSGTICPKCGRHMPRCGVCSLWLGSPDPMSRASMAGDAKKEATANANILTTDDVMKRFAVFCINCNHGFHADHSRAWFAKHRICPVAECNCICDK